MLKSPFRHSCTNCNKGNVYKYKDDFHRYVESVDKIERNILAPFDAIVRCNEFVKKTNNQRECLYKPDVVLSC